MAVVRFEHEFDVDWPALEAAREWVCSVLGKLNKPPLRYCLESTGTYHMPVMLAFGGEPTVVNPTLASPTRRKTDVLDARLLAHHSITGLWPKSFVPGSQGQELRILWARRGEYVRAATRHSNRVNNLILRFGHTIGSLGPIRSAESQALIGAMVEGDVPKVPNISPLGLPASIRPTIGEMLCQMNDATTKAREAEKDATSFVRESEWPCGAGTVAGEKLLKLLQTVPGVGPVTAIAWLAEVVDPTRFTSGEQVAAFCGCDPSLKVSAGKVTAYVRRKGNARLHKAIIFAASGVMRDSSTPLGGLGASIAGRHRKGGYKKGLGAIARRIACGLWHVHRKAEPFSYEGYAFGKAPEVPSRPLDEALSGKQIRLLSPAITNTKELARAYRAGDLTLLKGVGDGMLAKVGKWVRDNEIACREERRLKYVKASSNGPDARRPGRSEEAAGGKEPGRKAAVLPHDLREVRGQDARGGPVVRRASAARDALGGRQRGTPGTAPSVPEPRGGHGAAKLGRERRGHGLLTKPHSFMTDSRDPPEPEARA
jgi:transposase